MKLILLLTAVIFIGAAAISAQSMSPIEIHHIARDFVVTLDDTAWNKAKNVVVRTYWSGAPVPQGRQFTANFLWSDTALYVRFDATQTEPLVVSDNPDLSKKVKGLWDRDVCEIFIAPDKDASNKYFEFEVAPTGEWIDLGIEVTPKERLTDWEYSSKMGSAARTENGKVVMAIKIPFASLGKTPKAGDVWAGNIFRCVGKGPDRGYLAWRPTKTPKPNFHVPSAFGEFRFVK
jgi:alpha-galactosidase